jgi:DNA helicase-2/ATP-dependent DNA helicase PcrA
LNFEKDYPEARVIMLDQNYRSTQNILDAAHCVIEKNKNQKKKKLWTRNDAGELLSVLEVEDEKKEALFVAEEIDKIKKEENLPYNNLAVLYRTNAQSRAVEEAFLKKGIPYRIVGGVKFYQRKEIKDVLAYLYFLRNPNDEVSFERIINLPPRGLGKKTVERVIQVFRAGDENLVEVLSNGLELSKAGMNQAKIDSLQKFADLVNKAKKKQEELSVSELLDFLYNESGYRQMLMKEGEEGEVRHENVQELLTVAKKFDEDREGGVDAFLEEIALVSQADRDLNEEEAVFMMTIHSAKGLEFNRIFIVGAEEGLFPHSRAVMNEKEMEEERRLCYVGITRAKEKAYMLFTQRRNIYGSTQSSVKSRFLEEINSDLIEESYSSGESGDIFEGFYEEETLEVDDGEESGQAGRDSFEDGDRVLHPDFGEGIVISQDDNLITVAFPKTGLKKLAKQVAPLSKAD